MLRKSIAMPFILSSVLLLLFAASSLAGRGGALPPAPGPAQDCSSVTDQQILDEILAKLRDRRNGFGGNNANRNSLRGVNVIVKNKVVKLQGYMPGANQYLKVLRLVKNITPATFKCIEAIDVKEFGTVPPGDCDRGTQIRCGTICIGIHEPCNN